MNRLIDNNIANLHNAYRKSKNARKINRIIVHSGLHVFHQKKNNKKKNNNNNNNNNNNAYD